MKNVFILFTLMFSLSVHAQETKKKPMAKPAVKAKVAMPVSNNETRQVDTVRKEVLKPSKLQKQFVGATGIVTGEYAADTNSDECDSGNLKIIDYGDDLDLFYAGSSIIVGIGKDKVEEKYSDCKRTFRSKYAGNIIEEVSEEVCAKEKTVVTTTLVLEKDKISYTVSSILNDTEPEVLKCSATYQKDVPKK